MINSLGDFDRPLPPVALRRFGAQALRSLAVVLRFYASLARLAGGQTCLRLLVTDFRGAVLSPTCVPTRR
ncbi:MAG: hypothetical protein HYZ53_27900 [Planctomycetes bacterium]|nr:hypothetical protein [Planctomycetota bacterium]